MFVMGMTGLIAGAVINLHEKMRSPLAMAAVSGQAPSDPHRLPRDTDVRVDLAGHAQAGGQDRQALGAVGQAEVRVDPGRAPEDLTRLPRGVQRLPRRFRAPRWGVVTGDAPRQLLL